jgi:plastocyanin
MRLRLLVVGSVLAVAPFVGVPAAEAGGGCHKPAADGVGTTVETRDACFTPTVLRVPVGTTVSFVNRDGLEHNLAGVGLGFHQLGANQSASERFDQPGTFAYACNLHPSMTGAVVVGEQPVLASAVTDERDGVGWPWVVGSVALGMVLAFAGGRRLARRA